jgi:hypothetical protein
MQVLLLQIALLVATCVAMAVQIRHHLEQLAFPVFRFLQGK